jgi:hypothetical protein
VRCGHTPHKSPTLGVGQASLNPQGIPENTHPQGFTYYTFKDYSSDGAAKCQIPQKSNDFPYQACEKNSRALTIIRLIANEARVCYSTYGEGIKCRRNNLTALPGHT